MPAQPGDSIETLYVDIAARADQLVTQAEAAVQQVVRQMGRIDQATKETESVYKRLGQTIKQALTIATGIGFANIATQLIRGVVGFGKALIQTNAQMQMFERSFETLTGSAEEAGEIIEWVKEQAKATPFDVPGLIKASQMLMTWGLDLKEWFTVVGDVAAGMNRPLSQVVNAIGTLATGQTGEAVRRFRDLGINLRQFTDQLEFDARGAMITPLEEAIPIVKQIMIDKFGGMMESQSKTWQGVMSNMGDTWQQFVQVMGEPIFETLNESLVQLFDWVQENEDAIESFARNLGQALGDALNTIKSLLEGFGSLISLVEKLGDLVPGRGEPTEQEAQRERDIDLMDPTRQQRQMGQFYRGIAAGRDIQKEFFRAVAPTSEALLDQREKMEELEAAAAKLTEAQLAGIDAVRELGDAYSDLTTVEILQTIEQGKVATSVLEIAGVVQNFIPELGDLTAGMEENVRAAVDVATAYDNATDEFEKLAQEAAAAEEALAALRAEQEANLALAQEVALKLTGRLQDAMERYQETIEKVVAETAEAIADIEAEAAKAEADAITRSQEEIAKLREDFAREQLRRRRRFNMDWARLIRDQNQEVIDAEWEYEYTKQDLLIEGDEIALAELEARYAHEKDVRAREQGDARDDMRERHDFENEQRQQQFEQALRELEERLTKEVAGIRAKAQEEVEAKKAALEERLAHEDEKLQERLERIGVMLDKEVGDNQAAANLILQIWKDMYDAQVAETVKMGAAVQREMDMLIQKAIAAKAALASAVSQGKMPYGGFFPPVPGGGLQAGGYTQPFATPTMTHPGEWMANKATTQVLEGSAGGPLSQQSVRSLATSHRILDVFMQAVGVPAGEVEAIRRELVEALMAEGSEF